MPGKRKLAEVSDIPSPPRKATCERKPIDLPSDDEGLGIELPSDSEIELSDDETDLETSFQEESSVWTSSKFMTASSIFQLLMLVTWSCLCGPAWQNGLFKRIFTDSTVLEAVGSSASLCFCPGLFEAIKGAAPPSVDFFLSLPNLFAGYWGIYVVVLKKPGCIDLVYLGSGTDGNGSVRSRINQYNRREYQNLPYHVVAAMNNGYTIAHIGLLVWAPIPTAADMPRTRLLFVAMEASLAFLFWTMQSTTKDYRMGSCCPWDRDSFAYRGLCSHNALSEAVKGDFDLSAEELESIAEDVREKNREYQRVYHLNANKGTNTKYKADRKAAGARYRQNNPEKDRAKYKRWEEKMLASKKFYCSTCDVACSKQSSLDRHNRGPRHLKKVAAATATSAVAGSTPWTLAAPKAGSST